METIILVMAIIITVLTIMEESKEMYKMVIIMEMVSIPIIMRPRGILVRYYALNARKRAMLLTNDQKRNSNTTPATYMSKETGRRRI